MSFKPSLTRFLTDYNRADSLGSRLRARRMAPLLEMIRKAYEEHGHVRIIDLGGTERYWNIAPKGLLDECQVEVTLVNVSEDEMRPDKGRFRFVRGSACGLPRFADNAFHIVHSNSVIEHVGDWSNMCAMAREVKRLAPRYFVQTPNYWFPIEPHSMTPFIHWLPLPWRINLMMRFTLGHYLRAKTVSEAMLNVEDARLLNKRMFCDLFDDARFVPERIGFLTKSLIAVRC